MPYQSFYIMFHLRYATILLVLFLQLCPAGTQAQPWYFRHYQVENGLSNSTVFSCIQDKKGFLWFGTRAGLNRFDGFHFKLFTYTDKNGSAIGTDIIDHLFSDREGTLWVAAQRGLFRFDEEQEKLVPVLDSLTAINWVQDDDKGHLWFLSRNKIYCYDPHTKRLINTPHQPDLTATSICEAGDGGLWFTTGKGFIEKFNPATASFTTYDMFAHSPEPGNRWLNCMVDAGNNIFLVGTAGQGLKTFDQVNGVYKDTLIYNPDKTTIYVRDILPYTPGEFWLATESGIFIMSMKNGTMTNLRKNFLDPYSLSDNAVYSLCKDSEGGVWAGTFFGGVNYYNPQYSSFRKYFPDSSPYSISGSAVREICQDHNDDLWIGTEDAGLNKLDIRTGLITHFKPTGKPTDIAYTNIHGLLPVGNDCWIGTFEHGIDILDIRTGKVRKHYHAGHGPYDMRSNFALCFSPMTNGKILVGSSDGAYLYDKTTDGFTWIPHVPEHIFVAAIEEDHEGTIWVGSHGRGLWYYNPVTGKAGHYAGADSTGKGPLVRDINAIMEDSRHNMWFSTEGGGLSHLDSSRNTFRNYTTASGLPSNFIYKTIEDNNGDIWTTTDKGLVSLHHGTGDLSLYTRANGLLNDQFNYSSGFKDKEGMLYFGSVKGMITFLPQHFVRNSFIPAIYITGFQVDNKELAAANEGSFLHRSILNTDKITLPYNQSSFSIDFAALSYTAPDATEYSYKMEGLDKTWTYIKTNRKVYFTDLSPGKYIFKVKAAIGGRWNPQEKELIIGITPPFWATGWAWSAYILLTIVLIYYILHNYHKRTQIRKEKEIYEAKIEFFTNVAHEIRTPLTLIKGPLENLLEKIEELKDIREDVITMERNTDRLMALITQILDFRQIEARGFSLDLEQVDVTALLKEIGDSFSILAKKRGLSWQFDHPQEPLLVRADKEALYKIFSNLFSNAVKYAQKKVNVRLLFPVQAPHTFIVEFANDGHLIPPEMKERIFEPFYRLKETSRQKGTGIGLTLARSLTELHKGRLYLDDTREGMNIFVFQMTSVK